MKPSAITEHYAHFVSRTDRMMARYNDTLAADGKDRLIEIETRRESRLFCVVRLQHLWGEFCRELLVRSAVGGAFTIDGTYLTRAQGINRAVDVVQEVRKVVRRNIIAWHVPDVAVRATNSVAPANKTQILAGLSMNNPVDDIRAVRNYVVHPNVESRRRYNNVARKFGVFDTDPDALLRSSISRGNTTLFEDWVIQLQEIALVASW